MPSDESSEAPALFEAAADMPPLIHDFGERMDTVRDSVQQTSGVSSSYDSFEGQGLLDKLAQCVQSENNGRISSPEVSVQAAPDPAEPAVTEALWAGARRCPRGAHGARHASHT